MRTCSGFAHRILDVACDNGKHGTADTTADHILDDGADTRRCRSRRPRINGNGSAPGELVQYLTENDTADGADDRIARRAEAGILDHGSAGIAAHRTQNQLNDKADP